MNDARKYLLLGYFLDLVRIKSEDISLIHQPNVVHFTTKHLICGIFHIDVLEDNHDRQIDHDVLEDDEILKDVIEQVCMENEFDKYKAGINKKRIDRSRMDSERLNLGQALNGSVKCICVIEVHWFSEFN